MPSCCLTKAPTCGRERVWPDAAAHCGVRGDETRIGLFLDRGAKIDAHDEAGWTPLHCAATLGRVEEATFLVSRGSDVGIRDHNGRTPLDLARAPPKSP